MTLDWVLMIGLGGIWGSALRRGTAWCWYTLMSCDSHEGGWGALLHASFPTMSPSNLSQPHLTVTMRDSIYSTMSLCTHGPFPWHALERDTHTLTHMCTHVRARDLSTRAQWRKLKWYFLAFAAWLVLEGVVGGEEKQQPGGKTGERESLSWMWGR